MRSARLADRSLSDDSAPANGKIATASLRMASECCSRIRAVCERSCTSVFLGIGRLPGWHNLTLSDLIRQMRLPSGPADAYDMSFCRRAYTPASRQAIRLPPDPGSTETEKGPDYISETVTSA